MPGRAVPARRVVAVALALVVFFGAPLAGRAVAAGLGGSTDAPASAEADSEMTPAKAAVLGVVEGVTEFLPISSTGHLLVTQRLLDIGTTDETKPAADAYAIAIQAGAILAVLLLYWRRVLAMLRGAVGRDPEGRRVLVALILAFVPAAVVGLLFEDLIKTHLLGVGPVIVAWAVGGLVILLVAPRWERRTGGTALEQITARQALLIGVGQCLALWPGTSRSLVTILVALAIGLRLAAAVEFSFLLGLATLGAATAYETLTSGQLMVDTYGWVDPLIGLVVAFVSAAIAIRWMVGYLQRHGLAIFGWYRLGVAGLAAVLLATGVV